jgi:oligopeptide transport system ATP-binding protein
MSEPILETVSLVKHFPVSSRFLGLGVREVVRAVDGVNLAVQKGETIALVGESGCGKTTLGRLLLGLVKPTSGQIYFKGQELHSVNMRRLRRSMQIVFQDPLSSLNPRKTVREIIGRPLAIHRLATENPEARIRQLLNLVHLEVDSLARYPHEFSGGQQQRIASARALATEPEIIVADEPVSALDVSVQAQIVALLTDLRVQMDLTLILITHDLALAKYMADRMAVMYLGKIVELGNVDAIFEKPLHPYTAGLLTSTGVPDPSLRGSRKALQGEVPSPIHPPAGCRFHTRCPIMQRPICVEEPPLDDRGGEHYVACHLA